MGYQSKTTRLLKLVLEDLGTARFDGAEFLPTEEEFCDLYHVSRQTIRRVIGLLLEQGIVTRESNRRLKRVRHEEPTPGAAPAIQIAFAYAAYPDHLIVKLQQGIGRYASEHQIKFRIFANPGDHGSTLRFLHHAEELKLDGMIVFPYEDECYQEELCALVHRNYPVVSVLRMPGVPVSSVTSDDFSGAYEITRRLLEVSNRAVFFFGWVGENESVKLRFSGFRRAMLDAGLGSEVESHVIEMPHIGPLSDGAESMNVEWLADALLKRFAGMKTPFGVLCQNDYVAQAVYVTAQRLQLEIGKDVYVAGFSDLPMAQRLVPALSSVKTNPEEIGYEAAAMLHDFIQKKFSGQLHKVLPATYVERKSSGGPSA